MLLSSADFFSKLIFSDFSFRDTIRVSIGPDLGPNCLQGYQQTTKVSFSKERV